MKGESVVIASLGRSGSTLFYNSLCKHLEPSPNLGSFSFVKDLERFKPEKNHCYKTHDMAPFTMTNGAKMVFLFSDPIDIISSIKNVEKNDPELKWAKGHFENLHASFSMYNELIDKDVLKLEKMFESYYKKQTYPLLTLRYETMWDYQKEIGEFLEIEGFGLEDFKGRRWTDSLSENQVEKLKQTYGDLVEMVEEADNIREW